MQWLNDFTTFYQRLGDQPFSCTAIYLGHHQVLRHIHQTACQVPGVRCFQRRISQTFTRTVC
ncbi:hypothetical protein D3C73_1664140 [compost metagenome]